MFWEQSPNGRPFRKAGDLLIRFYHEGRIDKWNQLLITKFVRGAVKHSDRGKRIVIDNIRQSLLLQLKKGVHITNLQQEKWKFTKEEKDLIAEVNTWLKKNINGEWIKRAEI